ncbi:LysR family transcriptional regulator [Umezawaea endophytica]|uniref:LysR family transcriptional regulator n=1 Tax=Umezawaea endophytica TaxID=1654476 RepID=A0A9X2VPE3_9PSEU|nr:LysR family transcriptional regulator [Umezawaea endophytica]MCS7480426.1 LysR family transcriptional regulator [Umezawaea endophytica]
MVTPSEPFVDLDMRRVRYFLAVAEHEHFGRAASDLRVAQPSLSRQIRLLEREVGVRLIDRTTRGSRLTEAGKVFQREAEVLLRSVSRTVMSTRAAAQPGWITIGYATDLIITPVTREMRDRYPRTEVRALHLAWDEPATALLERRVDVVVARLPVPTDGLHVTVLYEEPRVLVVSLDHRLAGKESVTLDDIADEPLPRMPDPEWNRFWRVDPRPDGRRAPDGPLVRTIEDKLELIAANQAVSIAPAGIRASSLRPDLTTIPLEGVAPGQVVVVSRAADRCPLVTAFRELAATYLSNPARRRPG